MCTDEMDNHLVEQLLNQVQLGNRVESGFSCEAYIEICHEFEKVTRIVLISENVEHRMKASKKQCD
ncbi:hypothetical protein AMTRI_Chr13g121300 [Amborella trichopoda]